MTHLDLGPQWPQPLAGGNQPAPVTFPPPFTTHNVTRMRNVMYATCPLDEPDPDQPARRLPLVDSGDWLTIRERPGQQRQDDQDDDQRPALDPRFPLPHLPSGPGVAVLLSRARAMQQARQHSSTLIAGCQDWHPFDNVVLSDPDEEFVYPVIPVWEEDEDQLHTEANGYNCGDPTCDCAISTEVQR